MTAVVELAARIAALHPADRQWLWAEIPAEMRARLAAAVATVGDRGTLSARDLIASAAPEHVARALQTQPAWLAAVLLRMDEWPWGAALGKQRPLMPRRLPLEGQPGLAVKPALADAILESFARSLRLIEDSAPAPRPRLPPFEALLQRLRGDAAGVLR